MIDVINHIGMTVIMDLEQLIGTAISDVAQLREIMDIPRTQQVQMKTTIQDGHLAEIAEAKCVLTQGQCALKHIQLECATE
jgi:hypothetical protein